MITQKWSSTLWMLVLLAFLASACTPAPAQGTPAEDTAEPLQATPLVTEAPGQPGEITPPPAATADPFDACPAAGGGQELYTSEEDGICFLFPDHFTPTLATEGHVEYISLVGPHETPAPNQMEFAVVTLNVYNSGPADGLDSAAYAAKYQQVFGPMLDATAQVPAVIGGQPAVIVTGIPGFFTQQSAFIVANGYKYRIWLAPEIGAVSELDEHARLVWDTVINSIVFAPPVNERQYLNAAQVCPAQTADLRLYINERDGYCLLYPADFTSSPDFQGNFAGGPVLGDYMDFPDVTTSLTVGTFGLFPGQTPRQAFSGILQRADPASVQDAQIGGYPAVIMRTVDDPWATRTAGVLVNDQGYTILAQPWEPERWPDGVPYLERVWETVISSMAFFDPWR